MHACVNVCVSVNVSVCVCVYVCVCVCVYVCVSVCVCVCVSVHVCVLSLHFAYVFMYGRGTGLHGCTVCRCAFA